MVTSFVAGLLVGAAGVLLLTWPYGLLIGWTTAAAVFVVWFSDHALAHGRLGHRRPRRS
jgi:hypothetical protein